VVFLVARFLAGGTVDSKAGAASGFVAVFFAAFFATFLGVGGASSTREAAVFFEARFLGFWASSLNGVVSLMLVNRSVWDQSSCDSTASESSKFVNTLRVSS